MTRLSRYNIVVRVSETDLGILNGFTGGFCVVSSETSVESDQLERRLTAGDARGVAPEVIALLSRARMTTEAADELAVVKQAFANIRRNGLFHLTMVVTRDCNLRCPYCYQTRAIQTMSHETIEAVPALVAWRAGDPSAVKALEVAWYGGEPLLAPDVVLHGGRVIRDFCDRHDITLVSYLITNGTLLDRDLTLRLAALLNLRRIQITFDGDRSAHDRYRRFPDKRGTFDLIVENVSRLNGVVPLTFRLNINADRANDYRRLLLHLRERDLVGTGSKNMIQFAPIRAYTTSCSSCLATYSTPDSFDETSRGLYAFCLDNGITNVRIRTQFSWCSAINRNSFAVGPDGEIYKCWEQIGEERGRIGTVADTEGLPEKERQWIEYSPFNSAECRACRYLPICMGGCPYIELGHSNLDSSESYCRTMERTVTNWIAYNCLSHLLQAGKDRREHVEPN